MGVNESLSDQAAEEVRAMLARRRMSGRKLAERLGVSHTWVSYRLTGQQEIGLNELARIAEVLDVAVIDLLPAAPAVRTSARVLRVVGREPINEYPPAPVRVHSGDEPPTRGRRRRGAGSYECPTPTSADHMIADMSAGTSARRPVRTSDPHNRLTA
jgi:transcriptional regulator with XRE-family HTH domain